MKLLELIITLSLLIPPSESVTISGYSCQAHPNNAMSNCSITKSGTAVNERLMACNYSLIGSVWIVEGVGKRICLDTGAFSGTAHFDLYYNEYQPALEVGWQERRAWRLK